uniref:U2A'/phosphoprotein 32 family A C-terminal domain-containing protein n=1 Tax=Heliothis virescens TaxID=7102 RepID=A0A2A4JFB8_HELVI
MNVLWGAELGDVSLLRRMPNVEVLALRGAELGDVSLLRRMPNVEVLALSINKIRTLGDFAGCRRLRELYVRKNEINDLHEIRHLRHLPDLTSLWLDENPCTSHPQYRMTVLRNLPNLEKLDNVPVQPDEVQEAMRRGIHIPDSDDEGYPQQSYGQYRQRSSESSPEPEPEQYAHYSRRAPHEARSPAAAASLRHSHSAHSVKEYSYSSNGECRYPAASGVTSPPCQEPYYERPDRAEAAPAWEYPSAVMAERRGFTRRPVARNSNLLSAVLCLVKELDYPSLEVAEMAVRCRMDELANSQ